MKKVLKRKGYEFKNLKKSAKNVMGKDVKSPVPTSLKTFKTMKIIRKKEISQVFWDVSVKHLERQKILKKKRLQIYTKQYYVLENNLKKEFVRSEILSLAI